MHPIFAHRGVSSLAIENSEQAIQLCAKYNISAIEVDVQLLGDLTAVIFHDADFNRLANDARTLSSITHQELTDIQLALPDKSPQTVLTLVPFIQLMKQHQLFVNIELKRFGQSCEDYIVQIIHPLLKALPNERLLFSSFDFELLTEIRRVSKQANIAVLSEKIEDDTLAFIHKINAQAWHLKDMYLDVTQVNKIKKQVNYVGVFTVNDQNRYQQLRQAGVDYVFSDVPQLLG